MTIVARLPSPLALAGLWALTAAAALLAALVPGGSSVLQAAFGFTFEPAAPSLAEAGEILTANVRVAALPLLAALVVRAVPAAGLRVALDVVLTVVVGVNVAIVGAAVGAYGPARLAPWLVHLPVEWAGLAVPLGVYLAARRGRALPACAVLVAAAASVALLALGALVETYLTPRP